MAGELFGRHVVQCSDDIARAVLAAVDAGEELILPDPAARAAYDLKTSDRPAYDEVMRAQARRLDSLTATDERIAAAAERLAPGRAAMRDALAGGLPCLGICLGMQLLFEESDEGPGAGLALLGGRVRRLDASRVPQIGWNAVEDARDPLLAGAGLDMAYYANSFVCAPDDASHACYRTTLLLNRVGR